ncbi:GTP-dependent nucleic acid-binding protein EngD [Trichinella spiralis]|uniref:GTP-dependent nucleic acid-binding protein EngD n=1 Tax=Trichinella spiralis TaxID=6334 RepID=UPI0001EFEA8B|nr:GTP-dependent nucleic acid-binding protein EngD [Trichinella spiralis]
MPPKQKESVQAPNRIIGRIGSNLKIGIVGLPNVGKSTFFNVLTKNQVPAENYPFCTIDPNESRVAVPDKRFDFLCDYYKPVSQVPAYLNVVDIAGLVKGASEGQGLGNAFLSHISACDALFMMCRAFEEEDVTHVEGDVNPVRDLKIIFDELRLKDIQYVDGVLEKMEKTVVRANDKSKMFEFETLKLVQKCLKEDCRHVRFQTWNDKQIDILNKHLFLTAKPVVYLVNVSEQDYIQKRNKCCMLESHLYELPVDEREEYLKKLGCRSALEKIINAGYKVLQLEYFFTTGKDEVKAWTIQKGTKAPQAAGRIHTDFEKGFIMAEVMKFDDFKNEGSEAAAKAAGKYRQQGRNYVVEDGDIILFKFNAGAGLQGKKK